MRLLYLLPKFALSINVEDIAKTCFEFILKKSDNTATTIIN